MPTTTSTATVTADGPALLRLLAWISPAFPVGGFAYSHGLETAVERGLVGDGDALYGWIEGLVAHGSARNDAVLLAATHRTAAAGDDDALRETARTAAVLFGAPELRLESIGQGEAFLRTVRAAWPAPALDRGAAALDGGPVAYPVAIGLAAAAHGIARIEAVGGALHGFAGNAVSAAIRLGVIGQTVGQITLARLEDTIVATARETAEATLDDIGSASLAADLMALAHETQTTRLFRS